MAFHMQIYHVYLYMTSSQFTESIYVLTSLILQIYFSSVLTGAGAVCMYLFHSIQILIELEVSAGSDLRLKRLTFSIINQDRVITRECLTSSIYLNELAAWVYKTSPQNEQINNFKYLSLYQTPHSRFALGKCLYFRRRQNRALVAIYGV